MRMAGGSGRVATMTPRAAGSPCISEYRIDQRWRCRMKIPAVQDISDESQPTVFVVDDDASVRTSVARLIRSAGMAARTFASPAQFLKEPLPASPACIVLDVC